MPPTEYIIISKEKLLLKYKAENWEQKLLAYRQRPTPFRNGKKLMVQYLDGEGDSEIEIAMIRIYSNRDGCTEIVVHRLRDGNVQYSIT